MPTKRKTTKKKTTRSSKKTTRRAAPSKGGANRRRTASKSRSTRSRRESGRPGGGAGRREEVGGSGVYPASGPPPPENAPYQGMASWGQGERAAAGYEDSGRSEPSTFGDEKDLYGTARQKDQVRPLEENESTETAPNQPQNQPESHQSDEEEASRKSEIT